MYSAFNKRMYVYYMRNYFSLITIPSIPIIKAGRILFMYAYYMASMKISDLSEFAELIGKIVLDNPFEDPNKTATTIGIGDESALRKLFTNNLVKRFVLQHILMPRLVEMKQQNQQTQEIDDLIRLFVPFVCIFESQLHDQ